MIDIVMELCHFLQNVSFLYFLSTFSSLNALTLGLSTFDFIDSNPQLDSAFETIDRVFLIIFTIEMTLQFLHKGYKLFLDGWLIFGKFWLCSGHYFSYMDCILTPRSLLKTF